ncbi:hypothetical protein J6590_092690 [Homalodisca vitripennis]|nr:hypothetical protein J6590_092690 [Homalodisca vitripennis]
MNITFQDLVFCRYDKTHVCKLSRVTIHELRCPAKLRECPRWTEEIVPCPYNFSPWRRMLPPSPRNKPPRPQRPPPYPRDLEECWEEGCVDVDVECPSSCITRSA